MYVREYVTTMIKKRALWRQLGRKLNRKGDQPTTATGNSTLRAHSSVPRRLDYYPAARLASSSRAKAEQRAPVGTLKSPYTQGQSLAGRLIQKSRTHRVCAHANGGNVWFAFMIYK